MIMKKIFFVFILVGIFSAPGFSQTANELFKQAVSYYTQEEYTKALDIINQINSTEINTDPLRREIQKKIDEIEKNESQKRMESVKREQEVFNRATQFYNNGNYEEALHLLSQSSFTNINTQPLIQEINKKLREKIVPDEKKLASLPVQPNKSQTEPNKLEDEGITSVIFDEDARNTSPGVKNDQDKESSGSETRVIEGNINNSNTIYSLKYLLIVILFLFVLTLIYLLLTSRLRPKTIPLQLIGVSSNKIYLFTKSIVKVGRSPDNDFIIDFEGISRYHASIKYDKNSRKYYVKDLGSPNGTLINGKKIKMAKLKNGDQLNFYKMKYLVKV